MIILTKNVGMNEFIFAIGFSQLKQYKASIVYDCCRFIFYLEVSDKNFFVPFKMSKHIVTLV